MLSKRAKAKARRVRGKAKARMEVKRAKVGDPRAPDNINLEVMPRARHKGHGLRRGTVTSAEFKDTWPETAQTNREESPSP